MKILDSYEDTHRPVPVDIYMNRSVGYRLFSGLCSRVIDSGEDVGALNLDRWVHRHPYWLEVAGSRGSTEDHLRLQRRVARARLGMEGQEKEKADPVTLKKWKTRVEEDAEAREKAFKEYVERQKYLADEDLAWRQKAAWERLFRVAKVKERRRRREGRELKKARDARIAADDRRRAEEQAHRENRRRDEHAELVEIIREGLCRGKDEPFQPFIFGPARAGWRNTREG